jgi:hypothetical protein
MVEFLVGSHITDNAVDQAPVALAFILCKNKNIISHFFVYNIACLPPPSNRSRGLHIHNLCPAFDPLLP